MFFPLRHGHHADIPHAGPGLIRAGQGQSALDFFRRIGKRQDVAEFHQPISLLRRSIGNQGLPFPGINADFRRHSGPGGHNGVINENRPLSAL